MTEDDALRRDLLWRIESRRSSVQAFLRANRPRIRRRATLAVVLSSLAALFTAGPAFGGEKFSTGVQNAFGLVSDSYVWRVLCLLALLVSVASAVLTNLGKTQDDAGRLSSAEAAGAELEGLTSLLQYGQLTVQDGVKLYQQYSVKIPFIDDLVAAGPGQQGPNPQGPYPPGPYQQGPYQQGPYPQGPYQPGPNDPGAGYYQPSGPTEGSFAPLPPVPGPYPPQPPRG